MAGVEELFMGAVLGTLTSELYKRLENLIKMYKEFNPLLEKIKSTLDSLEPLIKQIEDENRQLNLAPEEIEELKKKISDGIKLLEECAADPKWYKKVEYTKKLTDLDESLKRQMGILTVQGVRDGKETLLLARTQAEHVAESTSFLDDNLERLRFLKSYGYHILKQGMIVIGLILTIKVVAKLAFVTNVVVELIDELWLWYKTPSVKLMQRLGIFVVVVFAEFLKSAAYLRFFIMPLYSIHIFLISNRRRFPDIPISRILYGRGFTNETSAGIDWIIMATAVLYYLYRCILLFTSVNCRC